MQADFTQKPAPTQLVQSGKKRQEEWHNKSSSNLQDLLKHEASFTASSTQDYVKSTKQFKPSPLLPACASTLKAEEFQRMKKSRNRAHAEHIGNTSMVD